VSAPVFPRVAALKTAEAFRAHLQASGIDLPFDDHLVTGTSSPLAQPFTSGGVTIGNRFAILPMEGWDGTADGEPSELTRRRWGRFGQSGAKLIWGGEAVAVRHDGRASPRQLQLNERTAGAIERLRLELVQSHRETFGDTADRDLVVGLQLTHSGRFAKPDRHDTPAPLTATVNPVLDRRFPSQPHVLTDTELDALIDRFVEAARWSQKLGFDFVDIKQCHGYLGHELLGARARAGRYGGSFENRTRFLRTIVERITGEVPGLRMGVRLSAIDMVPFKKDSAGVGVPESVDPVSGQAGFGVITPCPFDHALEEPKALLAMLESLGVNWICVTAGSPYYTPHVIRPAYFPPNDGYLPPEDPLVGVARHLRTTAALKAAFPNVMFVGSAYSYLQEWLPYVAQHTVAHGMTDMVGLGRMVLTYPDLPADLFAGRPFRRGAFCRTFSDCTTGPRLGHVSGCYPLDEYYKAQPQAADVVRVRTEMKRP
jgi:NADPH2 dehydrogenase